MLPIQNELRPTLAANGEEPAQAISAAEHDKIVQAAEGFEAMFIREMLSQMRKANETLAGPDGMFANSINADMLDMADSAIASQLAKGRSFGIGNVLLRQLLPENPPDAFKEGAAAVASQGIAPASAGPSAAFAPPVHRPFRQ